MKKIKYGDDEYYLYTEREHSKAELAIIIAEKVKELKSVFIGVGQND